MQKGANAAQPLLRAHIEQSKFEVTKITLHSLHVPRERTARRQAASNPARFQQPAITATGPPPAGPWCSAPPET